MPVCAFCGKMVDKATDDHIPPKGIFGDKPDYNLITVPSCEPCNRGTSKDDEYFKLLAMERDASETPVAWSVNESSTKAIQRKDRPKFGDMVRKNMKFGDVYTEGGIYLGRHYTLKLDGQRIRNTVGKVIRGLFFKHTNRPLPEDYQVFCQPMPKLASVITDETREGWEMILSELSTKEIVTVGPKVFRYRYCVHPGDENNLFFMLGFYERFDYIGWTHPKRVGQPDSGQADTDGR